MPYTKFVGHTERVKNILRDPKMIPLRVIDVVTGVFDEPVYELQEYTDGEITYVEFVQAVIYNGGQLIFTGIRNVDTGEIIGWELSDKCFDKEFDYTLGLIYCSNERESIKSRGDESLQRV